jgi:hypothetical protein
LHEPVDEQRKAVKRVTKRLRVVSAAAPGLKIAGTPTLIVMGADRVVRSVWRGQLDKDREQQLLDQLR